MINIIIILPKILIIKNENKLCVYLNVLLIAVESFSLY